MPSQTALHPRFVPRPVQQDGTIAFRARIGVTGHRHILNGEDVEREVATRLVDIRESFSPTRFTPVVFSILSALAEGADRLVVNVALQADSADDVELGAVLPLSIKDYRNDFKTEASQQEFCYLLSRAAASVELHRGQPPERHRRDAAYDRAGRYIVDHSDVLIAVWDGRESRGHGGTAEVVDYARQRGVPVLVVAARTTDSEDAPPFRDVSFARGSDRRKAAADAFRRIDDYNRVMLRSKRARKKIGAERARLGRSLECSSMYGRYMQVADWALPHLARADRLAVSHQRYHRMLAWAIHLLAAFAVTDVAVQTIFFPDETTLLFGEILFVLLLLLAVAIGRGVRLHERWIGYRSLAEAFRSALFFSLSCGDELQQVASAGVLGEPEEPWFQRAFSQAWRSCPEIALERSDAAPLRNFLIEAWIDRQIEYHHHTADRWRALHSLCTWMMGILAVATIAVALSHISNVGGKGWVTRTLTLSALILPAFGGAVAGMREYGQLRLHEERSKRAANRLRRLKDRLAVSGTLASIRHLAAETQRVTVDETLDWYGVVEFQDLDIVI